MTRDPAGPLASFFAAARRGATLRWVARAVVVLTVSLSVAALIRLRQAETEERLDDLNVSATQRFAILQRELERVEDQMISIEAFFGSSEEVTRDEFASFTRPVLRHHPEIHALEWAELVPGSERAAFEARLAAFAGLGARIVEQSEQGARVVAAERSSYVPVTYVEPRHGNEAALGFDLASEPMRAAALDQAARTGKPTATPRIRLVQGAGDAPSILLLLPHLREGLLRGYIVGVFRPDEILREALSEYPAGQLELALLEVERGEDRVLGWIPDGEHPEPEALRLLAAAQADGRVSTRDIEVGGRKWRLAVIASPAFMREGRTWAPWLALALGLITSCLVAGYVYLSIRHAHALAHEATHDPLSKLLNRRGLEQALENLRDPLPMAALLVNFDDFSDLNRAYGHGVGDVVLAELASRVGDACDGGSLVGRIGGDEVLVLAPRIDASAASALAERIRRRISALPVLAMPRSVHVTASIGVAVFTDPPPSLLQIIAEARTGLRASKAQGKNRTSFGLDAGAFSESGAKDALRRICREGDLRVIWEPLVRLSDEKIVGHELLVRGPAGELERPGELFRAATEQGLLTLLDMRCLRACVAAAREREPAGDLHINLLPSTLLDVPASTILRVLEELPAPAGRRVCIEVNEQQFVSHPSYLEESIRALRAAGIRIAIDDVGSGRGTLDSVLVLQPDIVKIDVSLVRGASEDPARSVQLGRLVRLCQSLDIEMVAEGVETASDRDFVRALGVGTGQGFFWHAREAHASV